MFSDSYFRWVSILLCCNNLTLNCMFICKLRICKIKLEKFLQSDMLNESGVGRCKLPHLEWINKVLLCSTGNHTEYPVINHNGKEHLKQESIYMYTWGTLLYSRDWHNTVNQLYFNFLKKCQSRVFQKNSRKPPKKLLSNSRTSWDIHLDSAASLEGNIINVTNIHKVTSLLQPFQLLLHTRIASVTWNNYRHGALVREVMI